MKVSVAHPVSSVCRPNGTYNGAYTQQTGDSTLSSGEDLTDTVGTYTESFLVRAHVELHRGSSTSFHCGRLKQLLTRPDPSEFPQPKMTPASDWKRHNVKAFLLLRGGMVVIECVADESQRQACCRSSIIINAGTGGGGVRG